MRHLCIEGLVLRSRIYRLAMVGLISILGNWSLECGRAQEAEEIEVEMSDEEAEAQFMENVEGFGWERNGRETWEMKRTLRSPKAIASPGGRGRAS